MIPLKHRTKCFINFLPSTDFDWDCIKIDEEKKVIYIRHLLEYHSSPLIKVLPKFWCFKTDGIFMNCCQSDVYATVIDQVIDKVFLGIDNVLMSYGQNFSGKTFSLSGFHNQYELRGIIPRFITDLFLQKEVVEEDISTRIWVSSIDIYGSTIYDLFSKPIKCCKEAKEVKKVKLKSQTHCMELLFQAESKRMTLDQKTYNAHTASNIITFTIQVVSLSSNEPNDKISKVHFVDLAGVETINRNPITSFKDQSAQGRANVTKTLLEIFSMKCQETNKQSLNIYDNKRINRITQYLDKSFSSVSNIIVMCHIRPNHEDLMITLSLLRFSMIIRGIPMKSPEYHLKANNEMTVRNLQLEIESLKDELLLRNLWGERCPMKISQDRLDFVRRSVKSFLNGNLTEYELLSVVDDCGLILRFVQKLSADKNSIERSSVALQTDEPDFLSWFAEKEGGGDKRRKSIIKGSIIKERASSIANSSRRVSFEEKPKRTSKTGKTKKEKSEKTSSVKPTKGGKATSKVQEKPVLVSQEVQVNLIEPDSRIPKLDSREGLWAQFMISRPEIQVFLDKLNTVVEEKNKILNSESLKFEDANQCLREKQMALNKMASMRHVERSEVYDVDGRVVVPEEESILVKEIKILQKDFKISQERLTEAQTYWLDALEKMSCEKKIIEKEFNQFCVTNELFVLNKVTSSHNEFPEKVTPIFEDVSQPLEKEDVAPHEVLMIPTDTTMFDNRFQEKYIYLQKKYLGKTSHFL